MATLVPMLSRERSLEALAAERFDLVVIGGGITGAGVALDAATRGYSVALVEKADFASGTSSRSSKLVHGGLRYLQNFDLGLVREALLERQLMVKLAPHLVRPLKLVVPAFDGARPDRLVGIGLNMYDVMATPGLRGRRSARRGAGPAQRAERSAAESPDADWSPARHRVVSGDEVTELLPALASRNPTGGYLFYDCQTDDSRLVLTVIGEAERFGAICANRLEVTELVQDDGGGAGVKVRDAETGDEFVLRADNVVRPHPSRGAPLRGRGSEDSPEPRYPHHALARGFAARGRSDRSRGREQIGVRPAVARSQPDRHHRQQL
jgi:glycerol-3-phosphate dehydrogenase